MVLKTKGLGTGTTFMRGSYVVELRLLARLCERTVFVKSERAPPLVVSMQRIPIYILNCSLDLQRSLVCQKCAMITKRCSHATDVRRAHKAASVPHTQTVLGTRYSTTVPCRTNHDITVYYVQLHIDDTILCIINEVTIVLY